MLFFGVPNDNPCTKFDVKSGLKPNFMSNLVHLNLLVNIKLKIKSGNIVC